MDAKRAMSWLLFCSLLLSVLLPAPVQAAPRVQDDPPAVVSSGEDDFGMMHVALGAAGPASPGATVALSFSAASREAAGQLAIRWALPDGGELLGGAESESTGPVSAGQIVQSVRQVRFAEPGIYRVMAEGAVSPGPERRYAAVGTLYFTVGDQPAIDLIDPAAVNPNHSTLTGEVTITQESVNAADGDEAHDPCVTVRGTVRRREMRPTAAGLVDMGLVPVANAVVMMREEDTLFDDQYGEVATGANGSYSFSFCDDDGVFDDELEIYVRLRAELRSGSKTVVEVEDSSYIDEVYEFDSNVIDTEGGTFTINWDLEGERAQIFNIADAAFQAWSFWNESGGDSNGDAIFDEAAEIHFEPGYGDTGSYYSSTWGEITVADTGDLDAWDDGVIMHEWGHMADDEYGCDDNGGGPHNIDQFLTDLELAWGEAYPDYYQSAVRAARSYTNASFYLDMTAMGTPGISEDLENYDTNKPTLISGNYELAISAMLWDMNDGNQDARVVAGMAQDPRDRVAHGHRMVQRVYTDPTFESNGDVFDDTCTMWVYLQSWVDMNLPTDAATAEAVTKNVGPNNPLQNAVAGAGAIAAEAAVADSSTGAEDPRWWDRVTFIVDNSASMAGVKIDATKTVMTEQINDLAANPDGTQFQLYTFNNTSNQIQPRFLDYFSAAGATSGVNQVSTVGDADPNCYVDGLSMLRQGAEQLTDGQAWLYTDGDGYQSPSVNNLKQLLNRQHVQASVVLLGGCGSAANTEPNLSGAEEAFLGVAANGTQGTGLLPYLMTALSSGGQFLYVANDQMADAAGILRAQLGHSAGAGKWSHYVSDEFTYRWDYLENDEYQWHFPGFGNTSVDVGQMSGAFLDYTLPAPFSFYGATHNSVRVSEDGVLRFSPCTGPLCPLFRSDYLNVLDTNLDWVFVSPPPALAAGADGTINAAEGSATQENGKQLHLFADTAGSNSEWVILTTAGLANYGGGDTGQREYQALLNTATGEIRYQYRYLRSEAASAQIGLHVYFDGCLFCTPFDLTVSNNDVAGASDGMGYKFTPAPPAPTRPHTVTVDGLATSIVFLLTGYSGDFEPLAIVDPGGTPVSCADTANVKCVTLDHNPGDRNVQYVEVKVNGRVGEWIATVDAGASGQATYSFTGLAAGGPVVDGFYDHLLPSGSASKLLVRLGRATDDNLLTAWLQKPDGSRWGAPFQLFDDGTNGDGKAGDGQFGLPAFTPPGVGVGYLWVSGMAGGVPFQRMEMTPISAQPFLLEATDAQPVAFGDSATTLYFRLTNQAPETHCYFPNVEIPDGWSGMWDFDPPGYLCLSAYASEEHYLTVTPPAVVAAHGGAAGGELETISVGFQEFYDEMMGDSVDVSLRHQGNPYAMEFDTQYFNHYLRAGSVDTTTVQVRVTDIHGTPVPDGTLVEWSVTGGTLDNEFPTTVNGMARTIYRVAPTAGDVTVNASTFAGTVTASAVIKVADAEPSHITLSATPQNVSAVATSLLVATVTDDWGDPVPNSAVRIGVEADGTKGTVNSAEVFEGLTDASGRLSITFTKVAGAKGNVGVRAELMFDQGAGLEVVNEARLELSLGGVEFGRAVFMPFVDR